MPRAALVGSTQLPCARSRVGLRVSPRADQRAYPRARPALHDRGAPSDPCRRPAEILGCRAWRRQDMAAPLTLPGVSGTIGARERGKRRDGKGWAMAKVKKATRRAAATDATQSIAIEGGQSVTIGGDQQLSVGRRQTVAVGTDRQVTVGGSDRLEVNLDQTIAVDRALNMSVGTTASLEAGRALTLTAARVTLRAAQELRLEVGASLIVLKPSGDIQIKGNRIEIAGAGEVHLKGANVHTN